MRKKLIISHPTGNANVRMLVKALVFSNFLAEFFTTIAIFTNDFLYKLGNLPGFKEIKRRKYDQEIRPYVQSYPWKEAARLIAPKVGFKKYTIHENDPFSIDTVYRSLDKKVSLRIKNNPLGEVAGVYAYEDCAKLTFLEAKRKNLFCFYDLPIGYWRTSNVLLASERERRPAWSNTIGGLNDSLTKFANKDAELALADCIFVASNFTAKSLSNFPGQLAPIEIIPYGFPPVNTTKVYPTFHNGRKLKLLYVGSLSQRKGIADLFEVADHLHTHIELTLVGRKPNIQNSALDAALAKHTWIPSLSHPEVLDLMRQSDILVFPSLFEGFGLVITESMSQGTPVITTERTAGPDLISHGSSGWIINAGQPQELQKTVEDILMQPDIIQSVGKQALHTAQQRPWKAYGEAMTSAISKYI